MRFEKVAGFLPRVRRRAARALDDLTTLAELRGRRVNVLFYSGAVVDEAWIRTTRSACEERGMSTVHVTSSPAKEASAASAHSLSTNLLSRLEARVLVTASSGLPASARPRGCTALVHMPHSLVSLHMVYPEDAFDGYDVLFSCGEHHEREIRAIGGGRRIALKSVKRVGYGKGDLLHATASASSDHDASILVAPSWGVGNVLESLGNELVRGLVASGHRVVVRPHSVTLRERPTYLTRLIDEFSGHPRVTLELDAGASSGLMRAGLMISDYSGVALEFAFARPRPVVFVETARKVRNPNYQSLGLVPVELGARTDIGTVVAPDVGAVVAAVDRALRDATPLDAILSARERYATHWGDVGPRAADAIAEML